MRSSRSLSQPVIGRSPSRSRLPLEFAPPVVEASFETPSVSALSLARERSVALSDPPAYWRGRSMSPAVSSAPATDSACINSFVNQLVEISENHSLIKQLERREYKQEDIIKVIQVRSNNISDAIKVGDILNQDRDTISRKIYTELYDLCRGALLLNGMRFLSPIDLGTSWELALTDINTKFLSCFFLGLRYIDLSISTKYNEYHSLMNYLTKTGITLLDLIDFRDAVFFDQLNSIYNIRFSYAERIQATRLMKVKNNSNF